MLPASPAAAAPRHHERGHPDDAARGDNLSDDGRDDPVRDKPCSTSSHHSGDSKSKDDRGHDDGKHAGRRIRRRVDHSRFVPEALYAERTEHHRCAYCDEAAAADQQFPHKLAHCPLKLAGKPFKGFDDGVPH